MPTYQAKKPEAPQSGKYYVEPGVYKCEVFTAEEKTSKRKPDGTGGNPMIELTLKVMLPPGGNADLEKFVETWGPKNPYNPRKDIDKS